MDSVTTDRRATHPPDPNLITHTCIHTYPSIHRLADPDDDDDDAGPGKPPRRAAVGRAGLCPERGVPPPDAARRLPGAFGTMMVDDRREGLGDRSGPASYIHTHVAPIRWLDPPACLAKPIHNPTPEYVQGRIYMRTRVVVTGLGPVSAIGIGKDAFWSALLEGKTGIDKIQGFDASPFPCQIGAEVRE